MYPHLGKQGARGGGSDEAVSALATEDQGRARFRRAVEAGEKVMQTLQENFEHAQQVVMQAQTGLEKLMQEAPLPVMPVST